MRVLFTLVPIAGLLVLGLLIALRSGVEGTYSAEPGRRVLVTNLSGLVLRLFGILAGLVILHVVIGYPLVVRWLH